MLGTKTVASVLKNFQKTIDDLNKIENQSIEKIDKLNTEIMDLKAQTNTAVDERDKANSIASKLEHLIS